MPKPSASRPVVGLIAGAGRFPFAVAREATRQGCAVVAVGVKGWVDPALAAHVDAYEELGIGELGRLTAFLKAHRASQAVMAGKVTKAVLLDEQTAFDEAARTALDRVQAFSVPELLGAIGTFLAGAGVTLLDSSTFLRAALCPVGVLTARAPSGAEATDIEAGFPIARAMAGLDVGQTVVVKGRVVVAVEALEGTDAAIQRAHALAGSGLVVVKSAALGQDRRFDLPVVGPETIATLTACGVSCLALEAGATLVLEREPTLAGANAAHLAIVGVAAPSSGAPASSTFG